METSGHKYGHERLLLTLSLALIAEAVRMANVVASASASANASAIAAANVIADTGANVVGDANANNALAKAYARALANAYARANAKKANSIARARANAKNARLEQLDAGHLRRLADHVLHRLKAAESWTCRCSQK